MTACVSMMGRSWAVQRKQRSRGWWVGIIATVATDLWQWLLQIVGLPPANPTGTVAGRQGRSREARAR
jgi:hypothetical protein